MAFHQCLLAAAALLLVGIVIIVLPRIDTEFVEVMREGVLLRTSNATVDYINLSSGRYELCILDVNASRRDYVGLGFEMGDGGAQVTIERNPIPITRVIDGLPYEVVCSFVVPREGTYFYTMWANGTELDGEYLDLIIFHRVTTVHHPTFLAGLTLVIAGLVCLPLVSLSLREPRQESGT